MRTCLSSWSPLGCRRYPIVQPNTESASNFICFLMLRFSASEFVSLRHVRLGKVRFLLCVCVCVCVCGGGGGGGGGCWGFLSVLSFLKSWPSPLDQQKKSMTLHKRSPKNVWPSPSPLNPSWYYWSLLTGCLRIVTHCHNTVAKRWISLSICHKTILRSCAGDPSNKYYIRIFVKDHTSVNFNSKIKCCGLDQMFLEDVANVPNRSQSIPSKLGKIRQELTVKMCMWWMEWGMHVQLSEIGSTWTWKHWESRGVRGHAPPGNFEIWAPWMAENASLMFENAKLMFSVSKSMTLPWLAKNLTLPHYSKISLMPLPSEVPAPHILFEDTLLSNFC